MNTPKLLSEKRLAENLHQIDVWLGRKTEGPSNPCTPACAFMMDYKTLDAIRNIRDYSSRLAACILELEAERDEYEKLCHSWMKSYDEIKEKYEPLIAVESKLLSPKDTQENK